MPIRTSSISYYKSLEKKTESELLSAIGLVGLIAIVWLLISLMAI